MKVVLGLAFNNFALGGQFQVNISQNWALAILGGVIIYFLWKYRKRGVSWPR